MITRKMVLMFLICAAFALIISVVAVALSPLWVIALLIRPSLANGISNMITGYVTKAIMSMMLSGNRTRIKV